MTELARLKFYATQPHSCSYLPEEQATTLFLDLASPWMCTSMQICPRWVFGAVATTCIALIARIAMRAYRRAFR